MHGAPHTQKADVENNGGSLENVVETFVLFLCGVQLVLRSGVFTVVLDLDWQMHTISMETKKQQTNIGGGSLYFGEVAGGS